MQDSVLSNVICTPGAVAYSGYPAGIRKFAENFPVPYMQNLCIGNDPYGCIGCIDVGKSADYVLSVP